MRDSKLVDIIISLSEEELRLFHRYVNSKFFNQNRKVILLFEFIRSKLRYKTSDMDKMTAFKKIFPNELYDDQQIRHVMSYLLKILKQFLAYREMNNRQSSELIALSRSLRKRNLWKQFDSSVKLSSDSLKSAPIKDMNFHYRSYQLEKEKYYALIDKKRATETNLQQVADSLDISYFASRLRHTCSMLAHKNVYKAEYDLGIVKDIIKEVNNKKLYRIPAIGIYYYVYLAMTEGNNLQYFQRLKDELITNAHLFAKEEIRDIYLLAINIGIRIINAGHREQMANNLELYKTGIEKEFLLTNGRISRFTYKNTTGLFIELKKYNQARQFIETYKNNLDPVYKEETYHYILAKLNYAMQQYDEALRFLMTTALSDDVYINLDTKILMAKVYFELKNIDALDALIANFDVFVRRKQVISYQRINYQNFIICLRKLSTVNQYDKSAMLDLSKEIEGLNPLPEKHWFLKQLNAK